MTRFRAFALPIAMAFPAGLMLAACGDDNDPLGFEFLNVAGNYEVTFTAAQVTSCQDFLEPGSIDGVLPVTHVGDDVTLELTEVTDFILNDPVGEIDTDGEFTFAGEIRLGNETGNVTADGTIEGSFETNQQLDLAFDFTALGCNVQGTIVGERLDA